MNESVDSLIRCQKVGRDSTLGCAIRMIVLIVIVVDVIVVVLSIKWQCDVSYPNFSFIHAFITTYFTLDGQKISSNLVKKRKLDLSDDRRRAWSLFEWGRQRRECSDGGSICLYSAESEFLESNTNLSYNVVHFLQWEPNQNPSLSRLHHLPLIILDY